MTAPNSVETFSPAGSGSLPASRSSADARAGDSGGGSAAVKGREGAAVSDATAVEGRDDSPAVGGRDEEDLDGPALRLEVDLVAPLRVLHPLVRVGHLERRARGRLDGDDGVLLEGLDRADVLVRDERVVRVRPRRGFRRMHDHSDWSEAEIRQAFNRFDANRSGKLDYRELRHALRALGVDVTDRESVRVLQSYDEDGNGLISKAEFRKAVFALGIDIIRRMCRCRRRCRAWRAADATAGERQSRV